jgi:HEAT repeat protein
MFDVDRRLPVWQALSKLFVDGELGEERQRQIAHVLKESGFSHAELTEIYEREVAPVCYRHLYSTGGHWDRIELEWLRAAILDHLERQSGVPDWWPFGRLPAKMGVQMTHSEWCGVMHIWRRLRRDPQDLAATLARSTDIATLERALDDLTLLGEEAHPARQAIYEMLYHLDFRVRASAVRAAGHVLGDEAVDEVLRLLDDDSPTVRSAALAALREVVQGLVDPHPEGADGSLVPTRSDHLLERIAQRALDKVCVHLSRSKSRERLHAARIIEGLGSHARPASERLFERFGDRNEAVRRAIADALVAIGPDPDDALANLKRSLFVDCSRIRQTAALCLGMFLASGDRRYRPALRALEYALEDNSAAVCRGAAAAIGWMGTTAADAVPRLAELVKAPEAPTRSTALFALGRMGDAALEELPTLAHALEDEHPEVRRAALRAFQNLGALVRQMTPTFEAMRDDPDWLTQFEAKRTLDAVRGDAPADDTWQFGARI